MFRRWLTRQLERSALRSGRQNLERFVVSLRNQPTSDIATLLTVAADIRLSLRSAGQLPDEVLNAPAANAYEEEAVRRCLARLVQSLHARHDYIDAAGAMVWLHTLRALNNSELQELGAQMWEQLMRGMPQAVEALARAQTANMLAAAGAVDAVRFVPRGLSLGDGPESGLQHH